MDTLEELVSVIYNEYNVRLHKNQIHTYIELFSNMNVEIEKVSSNAEYRITSPQGDSICIQIKQAKDYFYIKQTFEIEDPLLVDLIRHTISLYGINANILYKYVDTKFIYSYKDGILEKVVEKNGTTEKVIYEFKINIPSIIKEKNICGEDVKKQINVLLDQRNEEKNENLIKSIDKKLDSLKKIIS